jgi:hypothetical protein
MRHTPATSSGLKTTSAQITTLPSYLEAVLIDPPTSGITTLTIYDSENSDTTGKLVLAFFEKYAGESSDIQPFKPVIANRGIYCVLSAPLNTSSFIVHYSLA